MKGLPLLMSMLSTYQQHYPGCAHKVMAINSMSEIITAFNLNMHNRGRAIINAKDLQMHLNYMGSMDTRNFHQKKWQGFMTNLIVYKYPNIEASPSNCSRMEHNTSQQPSATVLR